ncbi:hypothetical protein H5202_09345 [Shewanella sp. SG41-4]|uniref:hypothetical protein n=1 Tax=Shewanella sp. SG41-4 TaxID=2760976 RepID=UPI001600A94A|nr:hypothetical protein [Shewanella sp. SG41-4]MBB1438875.1 hypothetical protein [Shewanella sp. SG41-4]
MKQSIQFPMIKVLLVGFAIISLSACAPRAHHGHVKAPKNKTAVTKVIVVKPAAYRIVNVNVNNVHQKDVVIIRKR